MDLIPNKKPGLGGSILPTGTKGVVFSLDKFFRLGTIAAVILIIVSLAVWTGFKLFENYASKKVEELQSEQAKVFTVVDRQEAERIIAVEKSAAVLQSLLKSHVYVSEFFDRISKYTLPRIQWSACVFNSANGKASLSGEAGDYSTLAKQLLSFGEDETGFKNIEISGVNLSRTGSVDFEMNLEIDSKKLQK